MLTVRDGPLLHSITDMTSFFQNIGDCLENNDFDTATTLLNTLGERPLPQNPLFQSPGEPKTGGGAPPCDV